MTGLLLLCGDIISQPGPISVPRKSNSPLKCLAVNRRSMKSLHKDGARFCNLERVQELVYAENADVVLISETWLTDKYYNQELFPLSNYIIFRKDHSKRTGGGVLIAVKSSSVKSTCTHA